MKRSTDRILTTHTGSLPRTAKVVELLLAEQKTPGTHKAELTAAVRGMTTTESVETLTMYQMLILTGVFALGLPFFGFIWPHNATDWIALLVNAVGLILQVSVTGRILATLGAGGAAALLPATVTRTFGIGALLVESTTRPAIIPVGA